MDRCWCRFAGSIQDSGERSKQLNHGTELIMHLVYTIHNWAPVCCYVPGAQPFCRPQSSKGSQEYLNRAFWKLERLPEYELKSLLRFMGKWLILTMYKILLTKVTTFWQNFPVLKPSRVFQNMSELSPQSQKSYIFFKIGFFCLFAKC